MGDNGRVDRAMSQFMLIDALSGIYYTLHIIDLKKNTVVEYNADEYIGSLDYDIRDARGFLTKVIEFICTSEYRDAALEFVNIDTLLERLKGKRTITEEFISARVGWIRARFITVENDENEIPVRIIFATEIIDDEKRREERLIKISLTDELTTLLNRRAYEEEIASFEDIELPSDLVYISLDLNGLKGVNDNLGHAAGDEFIINSAKIIRAGLGVRGKVFRTGGDEFMAIVKANKEILEESFSYMDELIKDFKPSYEYQLSISKGCASLEEFPNATLEELAHIADKRMYEDKDKYYRETGKNRRR